MTILTNGLTGSRRGDRSFPRAAKRTYWNFAELAVSALAKAQKISHLSPNDLAAQRLLYWASHDEPFHRNDARPRQRNRRGKIPARARHARGLAQPRRLSSFSGRGCQGSRGLDRSAPRSGGTACGPGRDGLAFGGRSKREVHRRNDHRHGGRASLFENLRSERTRHFRLCPKTDPVRGAPGSYPKTTAGARTAQPNAGSRTHLIARSERTIKFSRGQTNKPRVHDATAETR